MTAPPLALRLVPGRLAICRLDAESPLPAWVFHAEATLYSVTRTPDELSIVCSEDDVPPAIERVERGFRAFAVRGPLPFDVVGVIASLTRPLAEAGIPVFVLSTFDTDYVLVREERLAEASAELSTRFEVVA